MKPRFKIIVIVYDDGVIREVEYRKSHTIKELKSYSKRYLEDYQSIYFFENREEKENNYEKVFCL